MYDTNTPAMLAATGGSLGLLGMTTMSWALIAIAIIATGGSLIALGKRYKNRNSAKP